MKRKSKRTSTKLTAEENNKRKKDAIFRKKIRDTFTGMGFAIFPTANKHFKIGNRLVELDHAFMYENILVICEDTCGKNKDKDHIRKKNEAASEIRSNLSSLLKWLSEHFSDKKHLLEKYRNERILFYYIYISQADIELTEDERKLFSNLIFWDSQTLAFFNRLSQCIHYSARFELFRFFKIKDEQIGFSRSDESKSSIKAPIIYPEDVTGLKNGIRIVSFMMSADKLLRTGYVLRKDNWEDSVFLYQRLIEKDKINDIRKFLAEKGESFYNNVIVGLPDGVSFENEKGELISIENINDFQHCKLLIPEEMNSLCIIDGQHRIFAHYEASENEKYEKIISQLRKQLHLLVTGLIFPSNMKDADRKKVQSEIFLDINDNTKKVSANVLTHITMIKDPFSDVGLARRVLERLNKEKTFLNRFELSSLDNNKIKVASIIKYALRYLVTLHPAEGKCSLFQYWTGDKTALSKKNEESLKSYIEFCAKKIDLYFSAIHNTFKNDWNKSDSKLLSAVSINGFIIAFNRQLAKNQLQDFSWYQNCFEKMKMDFSKDKFPYTSSQYHKFSSFILENAFSFTQEEIEKY